MLRFILATILWLEFSSAAFTEEYLIRVDAVGYEDVPASEKVPVEQLFHSVQVRASLNQEFRREVRLGPEILTLEGVLKPEADGKFSLKIQYSHQIDTGLTRFNEEGVEVPVLNETRVETSIQCTLGRRVILGGVETAETSDAVAAKPPTKSTRLYVANIIRRIPDPN